MNIIATANEIGMSYDFFIKLSMHAVERKLRMMINKDKKIKNKSNCNRRHLFFQKYSHIPFKG